MAVIHGGLIVYSNDGVNQLYSGGYYGSGTVTVTETGLTNNDGSNYIYSGNKKFIGVSTTENATTPEFKIGDTITITTMDAFLYIVEEEISSSNKKLNIIYQGETLATLNVGDAKLLEVKDFKMEDDLVFEIVEDNLIYVLNNETTTYSFNVGGATKFSDLSFPLYSNENSNTQLLASGPNFLEIRIGSTAPAFGNVFLDDVDFEEITTSHDIIYGHTYYSFSTHGGGTN